MVLMSWEMEKEKHSHLVQYCSVYSGNEEINTLNENSTRETKYPDKYLDNYLPL